MYNMLRKFVAIVVMGITIAAMTLSASAATVKVVNAPKTVSGIYLSGFADGFSGANEISFTYPVQSKNGKLSYLKPDKIKVYWCNSDSKDSNKLVWKSYTTKYSSKESSYTLDSPDGKVAFNANGGEYGVSSYKTDTFVGVKTYIKFYYGDKTIKSQTLTMGTPFLKMTVSSNVVNEATYNKMLTATKPKSITTDITETYCDTYFNSATKRIEMRSLSASYGYTISYDGKYLYFDDITDEYAKAIVYATEFGQISKKISLVKTKTGEYRTNVPVWEIKELWAPANERSTDSLYLTSIQTLSSKVCIPFKF